MKKDIRKEIIERRRLLTSVELSEKSKMIYNRLSNFSLYKNAQNVMLYMDFKNEVKTNYILEDLLKNNKRAIIPISVPKTLKMILSEVIDPEVELERSSYGILEPKLQYIREVSPEILDLVIVPGVAFDSNGYRIGYGGGYYDYFFEHEGKSIPSVAIAFDLQLIPEVPKDEYDRPVNYIVTETQIINCEK